MDTGFVARHAKKQKVRVCLAILSSSDSLYGSKLTGARHCPNMRAWLGGRVVKNLAAHGFTIKNKTFESTISVARADFEEDRPGIFGPVRSEMGGNAKRHPESIIFGLLKTGFSTATFDGQNFFDTGSPGARRRRQYRDHGRQYRWRFGHALVPSRYDQGNSPDDLANPDAL